MEAVIIWTYNKSFMAPALKNVLRKKRALATPSGWETSWTISQTGSVASLSSLHLRRVHRAQCNHRFRIRLPSTYHASGQSFDFEIETQ